MQFKKFPISWEFVKSLINENNSRTKLQPMNHKQSAATNEVMNDE